MNKSVSLQILIPAYEYSLGINHILNSLCNLPQSVSIFISDDSLSDEVYNCVLNHPNNGSVTYHRNIPSLGASKNWNKIISESRSDYVMLLHHDEWPYENNFYNLVVEHLQKNPSVLVLDLLLPGIMPNKLRRHSPLFLKKIILNYFPGYLLRRNLIGAPSAVVFKRKHFTNFNESLVWMIDIDWYYQLFQRVRYNIKICSSPALISLPNKKSITNSISIKTSYLRLQESKILLRSGINNIFLKFNAPATVWQVIFATLESFLWGLTRILNLIWSNTLGMRVLPKKYHDID